MNLLFTTLEKILTEYTSGDNYETLRYARNEYFLLTGQINEDDEDYELRMNSFNDWYLFHFINPELKTTIISHYIKNNEVEDELKYSLSNPVYSLFESKGNGITGGKVLRDFIHSKTYTFKKDTILPAIMKKDLFTGRILNYEGEPYLLSGICFLPKRIKPLIKDECAKIAGYKDPVQERSFLLRTEYLKTKWNRYGHLDARKVFSPEY